MARRPRMISFRRFSGTPICSAAADCVSCAGRKYSSSSISPGGVGGRFKSRTDRGPLVVVLAGDVVGMAILKSERNAVLVVDTQAVGARQRSLQCFQSVARRQPKICESASAMQRVEL